MPILETERKKENATITYIIPGIKDIVVTLPKANAIRFVKTMTKRYSFQQSA